jgi:diaminopimelate epimerase
VRVAKYHGLGNDFVVVDLRDGDAAAAALATPARAIEICDRHRGIGADGVLAVGRPRTPGADAEMVVINADGSHAEMCGNGIRCVVKHLFERDPALRRPSLTIDTGAGPLTCAIAARGALAEQVTVDMGRPRLRRGEIPMTGPADDRCVDVPLAHGGRSLRVTAVSMGNPHVVAFVDETGPALRALAEALGPTLETHAWFPKKTNVEFARVAGPGAIELVVWERGCGITQACGTGACATAVAACLTGRARPGDELAITLLGGPLAITVAPDLGGVAMRGPAVHVFDAEL